MHADTLATVDAYTTNRISRRIISNIILYGKLIIYNTGINYYSDGYIYDSIFSNQDVYTKYIDIDRSITYYIDRVLLSYNNMDVYITFFSEYYSILIEFDSGFRYYKNKYLTHTIISRLIRERYNYYSKKFATFNKF